MSDKQLDPRQTKFLENYLDPKSDTFSNALQSALRAGYEEEYAKTITARMPKWLSENLRRVEMLDKAERNLLEILKMDGISDAKLLNIKADISKFIASRLGKKFYSDKSEVEHSGKVENILSQSQIDELLNRRAKENNAGREI